MIKYEDDKKETEKFNTLYVSLSLHSLLWYERNVITLQRYGQAEAAPDRTSGKRETRVQQLLRLIGRTINKTIRNSARVLIIKPSIYMIKSLTLRKFW
jgi:hypothetical protein